MHEKSEVRVLKFTFTVLAVAGCWRPSSWTTPFKHAVYNAYTMFVFLILYTFSMSQLMELVINANDADSFGDALFNILISLLACYKTIIMRKNHDSIIVLINNLTEAPFKPSDPYENMIQEKFDRRVKNNTLCYLIIVVISCVYIVSFSIVTQFMNSELLYKTWMPFDYTASILFDFVYMHQVMCLVFIGLVHPTSDSLVCGLLLNICCQIEILEYRLSNIASGRENLRDCVQHHIRIYEYAYMINEKFATIVPNEFAMVTIVMCYDLIQMAMTTSNAAYIQGMLFVASTLAAIFYYCWFGNELKLKSLELSDNIYNMEWTVLNNSVKKGLLMIMNRATIPIEFSGAHMPMNLDSFVAVLKTSYSLFNVLVQSQKE